MTESKDTSVKAESSRSEGGGKVTAVSKGEHKTKAARAVADPQAEAARAIEVERKIAVEGVDKEYIAEFAAGKPELQADLEAAEDFAATVEAKDAEYETAAEKVRSAKKTPAFA